MEQDKNNQKSRKIILIIILFLLVILIATYATYSYFVKNIAGEALKKELFESIGNNDLSFFLENELYNHIAQKIEQNDFELASNITLSTTMENNMFSNLDLSKFKVNYKLVRDTDNQKTYHQLATQYAENDLINLAFLTTPQQFAMISEEIVNRYVGVNQASFQDTINQIYQTEVDLSDGKKIKNFLLDREWIDTSSIPNTKTLETYANIIEKEILPENISKKENVILTMDSEQISTTEYTISLEPAQVTNLLERYISNDRK